MCYWGGIHHCSISKIKELIENKLCPTQPAQQSLHHFRFIFRVSTAQLHDPPPYQSRNLSLQSRVTENSRFTTEKDSGFTDEKVHLHDNDNDEKKRISISSSDSSFASSDSGSDSETDSLDSQSEKSGSISDVTGKSDYLTENDDEASGFVWKQKVSKTTLDYKFASRFKNFV